MTWRVEVKILNWMTDSCCNEFCAVVVAKLLWSNLVVLLHFSVLLSPKFSGNYIYRNIKQFMILERCAYIHNFVIKDCRFIMSLSTTVVEVQLHMKPASAARKLSLFFPCSVLYLILWKISKCWPPASKQTFHLLKIFPDTRWHSCCEILTSLSLNVVSHFL
jgi:hypothetical protein